MQRRQWLWLVVVLAAFQGAAPAGQRSAATGNTAARDPFDAVRAEIRKQLLDQQFPSLAIAVAREGTIVWQEGFGWADREGRVAATEHTMYSLASITKPFTATAIMILKERRRIDLDKPINEYLSGVKLRARVGDAADATVRRVANHSSGLPLHYQFFYEDEPYRPPSMDETIARYGNLVTAPGERYQYSNLGYGVLDYVVSRSSGKSYADFMREEVFLPLGLARTSVGIGPRLAPFQAIRYSRNGVPLPFYDFDHRGGSAIYSSAHDLVRFGMFHLKTRTPGQKQILSDASIDEMQKRTMENYGIGWSMTEVFGYPAVTHGGGMPGVTTTLWLFPGQKIAIAVLTNTSGVPLAGIIRGTLSAMLPQAKTAQSASRQADAEPWPPPELKGTWTGRIHTYKEELPLTLMVEPSGVIRAQLAGQLWTLVNQTRFRDGYLGGHMAGDVGTEDASRRPHTIQLTLKLRGGNVLNGSATAMSIPNSRGANALTYWTELKKQE